MSYNNRIMEVGYIEPSQGYTELTKPKEDYDKSYTVFYYNPGRSLLEQQIKSYCKEHEIAFINLNKTDPREVIAKIMPEINSNMGVFIVGGEFSMHSLKKDYAIKFKKTAELNEDNVIYTTVNPDELIEILNSHLEDYLLITH